MGGNMGGDMMGGDMMISRNMMGNMMMGAAGNMGGISMGGNNMNLMVSMYSVVNIAMMGAMMGSMLMGNMGGKMGFQHDDGYSLCAISRVTCPQLLQATSGTS